jgi:hypothetical protein
LTVSTDQRLNVWDVDTAQGIELSLGDAHHLDVPDPSAMDVTIHKYVFTSRTMGHGPSITNVPNFLLNSDTIVVGVTGIGFQLLKSKKLM